MKVLASGQQQITLYYGQQILNERPYFHTGIDIVKERNSLDTIVAAEKGKVVKIVSNVPGRDISKGYGNYIELQHGDNIVTKYCHLKYGSIKVKVGQIVEKAQEIGYMGDTGYTFGAHLHFQVIKDGKTIDPLPYLKDEKKLVPYNSNSYTKANYIVAADVLNVRIGAGTNYSIVKYPNLTVNAKEQMEKLVGYPANGYVKGMEFTALEIKNLESEAWARTPSGWVCIYNKDGVYCKKTWITSILEQYKIIAD